MKAPLPPDEPQRLAELEQYAVLDTPAEESFDDLNELAARICQAPIALITLIDQKRQWFKSKVGLGLSETAREIAFCAHAINQPGLLIVPDATQDPRFADNPLVTGEPHIRFYAGAPLITPAGHALGTLCVIDREPRDMSPDHQRALRILSRHIMTQLELRRRLSEAARLRAERDETRTALQSERKLLEAAERSRQELARALDENQRINQALRESDARLQLAVKASRIGLWEWDITSNRVSASAEWRHLIGCDVDEMPKSLDEWETLLHPDDKVRARLQRTARLEGGSSNECQNEFRLRHKDGSYRWISTRAALVRDSAGKPVRMLGCHIDVTDRVQTEQALRRSEQRYRLAASMGQVWDWDIAANVIAFPPEFWRRLGYEDPAIPDTLARFESILHPGDVERRMRALKDHISRRVPYDIEYRARAKSGEYFWFRAWGQAVWDESGRATYMAGTTFDITARKKAEEALRKSEAHLRAIIENEPECVKIVSANGRLLEMNPAGLAMLQATSLMEAQKQTLFEFIVPEHRAAFAGLHKRVMNGESGALEFEVIGLKGARRWLETRAAPMRNAAGAVRQLLGITRDITERKGAEEKLLRFRMAMESSLEGIFLMDFETFRYLDVNETGCRMLGYTRDELLTMRTMDTNLNISEADQRRRFEQARALGTEHVMTEPEGRVMQRKDGSTFPIEVARRYLRVGNKEIVVGIARDITERKLAEQALREGEQRYRELFQSNPHPMWVYDTETLRFLAVNDTATVRYGFSRREFLEMTVRDIRPPEDVVRLVAFIAKPLPAMSDSKTWRHRTKSGHLIDVEISSHDLVFEGRQARMVVAYDITERTRADEEVRRLNADLELRVAQRTAELQAKNKELETFSYSVSHDLKAPLRGIDGYSRLLLTDYESKLDEEGLGFLRNIRSAASQMRQLIDDLLAYSKLDLRSPRLNRIDLRVLLETLLKERVNDLKAVRLSVDVSSDPLQADREGLSIVLRNLIDNAVKFSSRRDPPALEIRSRVEGGRHIVSVRDNGIGFDMKYHDRIFQVFQRLHRAEDYSGTGVGLAIVHKAVERMGGRVWAESAPGKGATFHLDLPRDGVADTVAATDNAR